jgi:hypothetical protein
MTGGGRVRARATFRGVEYVLVGCDDAEAELTPTQERVALIVTEAMLNALPWRFRAWMWVLRLWAALRGRSP